jgi:large subunit ribosomal protein L21
MKAVIKSGARQYIVSEGDELDVNLTGATKSMTFEPLMVIDGETVHIGAPSVEGIKVTADVVTELKKGDKVVAIRYKAKKRVKKIRGHRQSLTTIKIAKIGK